jgi:HD-GYP domain-containing protein (c-di-GMP phosphodiesterase class II)
MLKRIDKSEIRPGMFVEDLEGAWNDNPFSSRRFLLETSDQLRKLKQSKINAIIINTALGIDVSGAQASTPKTGSQASRAAPPAPQLAERVEIASQIIAQSETVVEELFRNVRSGGAITVEQAKPVVEQISQSMRSDPVVFLSVSRLKSKDETTFLHSIAVSALMVQFGRYLKLDEDLVQLLGISGLVHDIGKMSIPDDILCKEGKLTEGEFKQMRGHPALGHAILSSQGNMPEIVLEVCLNHHEQLDGKGYPNGLAGNELSLPVRISTICDVYEAVTSVRPYKKPWKQSDAFAWMLDRQGHFDRPLLREFIASLELMARNAAAGV